MITEEEIQNYGPMVKDIMIKLRNGEEGEDVAAVICDIYGFGYHTSARLVEKCYTILMEDEEASVIDISNMKRPN